MPETSLNSALDHCKKMIRVGSKSFSLAALLLQKENREAAFLLYGWCRYCDDAIDEAGSEVTVLKARLAYLREQTTRAYSGEPCEHPIFVAFQYVVQKHQIPKHYPMELLEGMAMDIERRQYRTFEDLLLYCYRVAGTVGLMMTHVMGTSNEAALEHASHMGIAMQLTNIARDITDDATLGRVYLPLEWLEEKNLTPCSFALLENRSKIVPLVERLLDKAETFYVSGDQGLRYLRFRPACAASASRMVYSEIGTRIRQLGPRAWDSRVWISRPRKWWLLGQGVLRAMKILPQRILSGWSPVSIRQIWSHS